MARTELPNGVILPAEYSDDWYEDMTSNLTKLDDVIGSDADKLSAEDVGAAALSNDYTDLDNKPALKPVATSGDYDDLDNKPDLKPVATSGDYDDLTDLPTYGITRYCSSAITDNSSVAFSAISSTNKIKVGDFLLDTAGKMYQISAVDTANETVSVTTPLTQLAVDSGVMHLTGNETAGGFKTFNRHISIDGSYIGNEFSSNVRTDFILRANRDTEGKSCAYISRFRQNKAQGSMSSGDLQILGVDFLENEVRTNSILSVQARGWVNDVPTKVTIQSSVSDYSYGSTLNPCKINNLNPGALSFPNLSSGLDISSYITLGSYVQDTYTPTVDGYISIMVANPSACGLWIYGGDFGACSRSIGSHPTYGNIAIVTLPVKANITYTIETNDATSIGWAKFYPNLGNI